MKLHAVEFAGNTAGKLSRSHWPSAIPLSCGVQTELHNLRRKFGNTIMMCLRPHFVRKFFRVKTVPFVVLLQRCKSTLDRLRFGSRKFRQISNYRNAVRIVPLICVHSRSSRI